MSVNVDWLSQQCYSNIMILLKKRLKITKLKIHTYFKVKESSLQNRNQHSIHYKRKKYNHITKINTSN